MPSRCSSARRSGFSSGSRRPSRRCSIRSSRCCGPSRRSRGCRSGWCSFLAPSSPFPGTTLSYTASDLAAIFTIAICSMWPTVLNTAVGVRAIPQDYLNVAKVLKLSKTKTLFKVLLPATLPYMFTGFRLSLGIAWLVIVAAEMLTGKARRRRLPVAAIQRAELRAHHPVHPDDRHRGLRPRPADEPGGKPLQNRLNDAATSRS